jgi:hypothetical protein
MLCLIFAYVFFNKIRDKSRAGSAWKQSGWGKEGGGREQGEK